MDTEKLKILHGQKLSSRQIAAQLGVSKPTVQYWSTKLGLKPNFPASHRLEFVGKDKVRCRKCKSILPLDEFKHKYQLLSYCKDCHKKQKLDYRSRLNSKDMRVFLWLLAGATALTAQPQVSYPSGITHPEQRESMTFDVRLALSGRVVLEDRQPPPEPVRVEYSCRGDNRGSLTDSKGRFSIILSSQRAALTDVLTAPLDIEGCRVEVRIPGFEELVVTLPKPHRASDLTLGDLTLKATGPQGGASFSETGRNAPAKARANYVRAIESINTGQYPDALAALDKALAAYPKYASALLLKGVVLERTDKRDAAREAYQAAVAADPAYSKPLVQLAEMAAQDQNPTETARWAAMANQLVPGAYPGMYLIEGSSYFDLKRYEEAGKAAQAGIDADPKLIYPSLRKLMAEVLYQKRSYSAALELFEWYLKEAPQAADVETVQERVQSCKRLVKTAN